MFHLLLAIIYMAFISLGLPDGILGAAWPTMYPEFAVPVSYAGVVSPIIAVGTIFSSLMSDRLNRKLGTGKVTFLSVALSAITLFGFSLCTEFWQICLWAFPYGLAAGSIDAALNNYVALHYTSRHMSWLHCMWGVGAAIGPYIMGFILTGGGSWNSGYQTVGLIQVTLAAIVFCSLPMWKKRNTSEEQNGEEAEDRALGLGEILRIPGTKEIMITFFCYCAVESTSGLWASSYLVLHKGVDAVTAASFASLFYVGITIGRALNGFLTVKFSDTQLIRMGQTIVALGLVTMLLPLGQIAALAGLVLVGLGCAPVYPCIIHSTPEHFGANRSQSIIGVQMASAYTGTCIAPPIFGLIAQYIHVSLFPIFLLVMLVCMLVMHEKMLKVCAKNKN